VGYLSSKRRSLAPISNAVPARRLPTGGTIGLFSPSEPLTPERRSVLEQSLRILSSQGYQLRFAPNALAQGMYAAGNAGGRAADMHTLAADPEVHALLATWGGKSCNQLLDLLDFELLGQARKPVSGFSDVAVLLNALTASTGLMTYHFLTAGRLDETTHADLPVLVGSTRTFEDIFDFHAGHVRHVIRPGSAEGRLFGGNLQTFVLGLLGTPFLTGMQDIIFFWESASERPMVIDQHLTALLNVGFFDRVRGMVIGAALSGRELSLPEVFESIEYVIKDYSFPVVYSPTFGHLPTSNPIIPIGARAVLDTESYTVQLLEPAVS
jgi:muramoyltetrapeptide carboxypeptidase